MPNPEQEEVDHDAVINVLLESQEKAFEQAETNNYYFKCSKTTEQNIRQEASPK